MNIRTQLSMKLTVGTSYQLHKAKKLNDYVRKQTQGKIKELISDLDEDTAMLLVNYSCLKGEDGH
ncbi:hypothetical protein ACRRTK_017713 [Alexandromys fortis]